MTDLEPILSLWHELESEESDYVLATVVAVEGSSYRRPGASMLLAKDGRRAGTVSGGCLEAEVTRRAWWLTENGPVVERYSTLEDDGDLPYGSGCGGVVFILLERRNTAAPLLTALESAFLVRLPLAIATVLEGPQIGARAFDGLDTTPNATTRGSAELNSTVETSNPPELRAAACHSLEESKSSDVHLLLDGVLTRVRIDYRPARPALWIFGAGDDVSPLARMARELGWHVVVADGRAHLATRKRFPQVQELCVLPMSELPRSAESLHVRHTDAAVLMTHSFEQDSRILASLLRRETLPVYVGVLGPQRRTREALIEAARLLELGPGPDRIERWLEHLHAPMGLDLGADTPALIALSILSEVQKAITAATALPLSQVRATKTLLTTA